MLYLCDFFFYYFSLIFIAINHITSLKQTHLFFPDFLEYLLLLLDGNVDEESKLFSNSESSASGCCLAFAWFFANSSLALLKKVLLIKKGVYIIKMKIFKEPTVGIQWNGRLAYLMFCKINVIKMAVR